MTFLVLHLDIQIQKLHKSKSNIILYFATEYFISAKSRQCGLRICLRIKRQMNIQVLNSTVDSMPRSVVLPLWLSSYLQKGKMLVLVKKQS